MQIKDLLSTGKNGRLMFSGIDTVELAGEYGTPLYVMDEEAIRQNMREYKRALEECYGKSSMVCYASKAFACKEIYRIAMDEGIGADVVSAGELLTAVSVDFPADKIVFHGNNKSDDELLLALNCGVGLIAVDNIEEIRTLDKLAKRLDKKAKISLRIKPGVTAHTHEFIRTGAIDSKFGFALETGEAMEAVLLAANCESLALTGFNCHIGSQIFDAEPFAAAAEVMLEFIAKVQKQTGAPIESLNLGGGFAIRYTDGDREVNYREYSLKIAKITKQKCEELGIPVPFMMIEPGRSIVGNAGITLYKVGAVKNIPGHRKYVLIDGGFTDNPRYSLYGAKYDIIAADKAAADMNETITLAGKCCESGDLIGENMPAPSLEPGGIVAVLATGAYNYSMASNYNRLPKPAVVMLKGGKSRIVVKRETLNDLLRNDI
ncbi:MAG: diaminopimelate decarboxylase [Oscillospiraceae bacterium]|nr:diaminopimelate decarboxylase [Oscillospiraceae bacterium]